MKFFLDNNLSPKLARALHALAEPEHEVIHLKARFAADTPDEEWMLALAKEPGWIIISGDVGIAKNRAEIEAWKTAGHTTFFLKKGWINLRGWDQFQKFVKVFPEIIATAERVRAGSMFFVTVNGKIERD